MWPELQASLYDMSLTNATALTLENADVKCVIKNLQDGRISEHVQHPFCEPQDLIWFLWKTQKQLTCILEANNNWTFWQIFVMGRFPLSDINQMNK